MPNDDWESGNLGRSEAHAVPAPPERGAQLDSALGLQMISLRINKKLLDDLKFCATAHGMKYQPFMRDALEQFCATEIARIRTLVFDAQEMEQDERKV